MDLIRPAIRSTFIRLTVILVMLPFLYLASVSKLSLIPNVPLHPNLAVSSNSLELVSDNATFESMSCPKAGVCFLSGFEGNSQGAIDFTNNNGITFMPLSLQTSLGNINQISCPTVTACYIAVQNQSTDTSQLYLTLNGGATFNQLGQAPTTAMNYMSISCSSATTCMFVGSDIYSNPFIYTTENAGASFNTVTVPVGVAEINDVSCDNVGTCGIAGVTNTSSPVFYFEDNMSTTFSQVNLPTSIGSTTGISCSISYFCILIGTDIHSIPIATVIDLNSQTVTSLALPAGIQTLNSVSCQGSSVTSGCLMVGSNSSSQPAVLSTLNFGTVNSVTATSPLSTGSFNAVSCSSITSCGILGNTVSTRGLFAQFNQGSLTLNEVTNTIPTFRSLDCVNSTLCLGATSSTTNGSELYSSNNFGGTFNQLGSLPGLGWVQYIQCPSSTACFVAGQTDGMPTLYSVSLPTGTLTKLGLPTGISSILGMSCFNSNSCIIVTVSLQSVPQVFITTNSASAWTSLTLPSGIATIGTVSCVSASLCAAIATTTTGNPAVLYSNSPGISMAYGSLPSTAQNLTSIDCFSTSSCIVIGDDQAGNPFVAVSSDSGTTYSLASIAPSNNILETISCQVDALGNLCVILALVAANNSSFVYESNNAGANWIQLPQPSGNYPLNQVSCVSSTVCLATGGLYSNLAVALNPAPLITSVSPNSGPLQGGTMVNISGSGLEGTTTVDFGSTPASQFSVVSDTLIQAVSPPGTSTEPIQVSAEGISNTVQFNYEDIIYNPVTPFRICDTRAPNGTIVVKNQCDSSGASPLGPKSAININVAGLGNPAIPLDATAVVVNLTVTDTTSAGGFLGIWPAGSNMPNSSNINFGPDDTVANMVQVGLGTSGQISLYNFNGSTDVIVDVEGFFAPSSVSTNAGGFVPLSPSRVCDTRSASSSNQCNSNGNTTLSAGSVITVQVAGGSYPIPASASAVVANLTATNTTSAGGFLTAWPSGTIQMPNTSNLNFGPGVSVANRIIIPIDPATGTISIYNFNGSTDIILDINGYFTSGSSSTQGLGFNSITPTRICDTRQIDLVGTLANQCDLNGASSLGSSQTLTVKVAGIDSLPNVAQAVVANITAADTTQNGGFFTVYPAVIPSASPPTVSDLNWSQGEVVANLVEDGLGTNGAINVYNYIGNADLIVDVTGYYS